MTITITITMSACNCKTLVRASLSCLRATTIPTNGRPKHSSISLYANLSFLSLLSRIHLPNSKLSLLHLRLGPVPKAASSRSYSCINGALSRDTADRLDETPDESSKDTVEDLILNANDDVGRLMKMERRSEIHNGGEAADERSRWFPYLDLFKYGGMSLSSREVVEAIDPYILEMRKERFRNVVKNRSYSVCLVVEGLSDFGNVSAAFRSADALGFQSVHVVSYGCGKKRYKDNRHVSMGAEKWLDIELWESTRECFKVLKSRGYRIATTHLGTDAVSIYDMDWSFPTAIVVGNENRGISDEALELSDLRCSIPMKGMVDSFNVSVAAGILMHHAVCDRISRLGSHGDLTHAESQILLAEFSLRHSKSAVSVAHEYAKRKVDMSISKL